MSNEICENKENSTLVLKKNMYSESHVLSFWSKVDIKAKNTDCWEWMGAKKPSGYGNVRIDKKYRLAHRVSWEITNFEIPDGMIVCHTCDNPSCCNPHHLMLGTIKSNAADMVKKGRAYTGDTLGVGVNNVNAKLDWDSVTEIRDLYINNIYFQYELAELYGVTQPAIGSIVRNETWRVN